MEKKKVSRKKKQPSADTAFPEAIVTREGRGGARPGSGRKKGDTELVSWHLRRATILAVKAAATAAGRQPGSFVDEILTQALKI